MKPLYILGLEAKDVIDSQPYRISDIKKALTINGRILPYSLDIIELKNRARKMKKTKSFFTFKSKSSKELQGTDLLINVSFGKEAYETLDETYDLYTVVKHGGLKHIKVNQLRKTWTKKEIRAKLYEDGFNVSIKGTIHHYVRYKRSAAMSRGGSHLFIREDFYKPMMKWSRLGMEFEKGESVDLASLKAYESLSMSGIIGTVTIAPDEILLIDDYVNCYEGVKAAITRIVDGQIYSIDDDAYTVRNKIWDGQSLLDRCVFESNEGWKHKGMLLLRNRFFKSAGFSANIQDFFDDYFGKDKPEWKRS